MDILKILFLDPPKEEAVTFTLHPDTKENNYDTSNVHTCSGDVGYPVGLGYLSLKFTDPTTNASFTYDKLSVTEDTKTSMNSPLKFQVNIASGLSIIIVEDKEPENVNCTRNKEIKFLLQATREWNKAKIHCRVISEDSEVKATAVEEEIYVIPGKHIFLCGLFCFAYTMKLLIKKIANILLEIASNIHIQYLYIQYL